MALDIGRFHLTHQSTGCSFWASAFVGSGSFADIHTCRRAFRCPPDIAAGIYRLCLSEVNGLIRSDRRLGGSSVVGKSRRNAQHKLRRLLCKRIRTTWLRQNNPTGKSPKTCPAPLRKIFRFFRNANQAIDLAVLPGKRGVAHVTNARWDAVDEDAATDERGGRGRRKR